MCGAVHTIAANIELYDRGDFHVDHPQEALVFLLEFLLVKDLNREDIFFFDLPARNLATIHQQRYKPSDAQVEAFIPVWVQGLLYYSCSLRLLPIDRRNRERIRKPYCCATSVL